MSHQKKRVFLGGTCNGSTWRDDFSKELTIDYYNPVIKDWTPECQELEIEERKSCDYCLYVLTPMMTGCYSVAEVVDDSNKRPEKTVLLVLESDGDCVFTEHQVKSMQMVKRMVAENGAYVADNWSTALAYLNNAGYDKAYLLERGL